MNIIDKLLNIIKYCENCDGKINKVIWICLKDKDLLCEKCKNNHASLGKLHTFMDYKEYQKESFFLKYNDYMKIIYANQEQTEKYNKELDRKNKFLLIDLENIKIIPGQKWMQLEMPDDNFLTISFVGLSGSGKSTTIGPLFKSSDGSYPVSANLNNSDSTSSDINAFIGETIGKEKYLILDYEGIGGDLNLSTMGKNASKSRFDLVNHSYPKLLYLISDIMVFVSNGQREKGEIYEHLLLYGTTCSKVTNNLVRPHLIILLNNRNSIPNEFYEMEYAKKEYFKTEQEKLKQLELYFQSISLIYFPNFDSSIKFIKINLTLWMNYLIKSKRIKQFSTNIQMFDLSRRLPNTKFKILKKNSNPFIISFQIDNPPNEIDIICKLQSLSLGKNETSISNCPFKYLKTTLSN